jgi:ribonuclease-3
MINFSGFEKSTKVSFKDKELLKQAFMHRSYINENPGVKMAHNERLEFLGDAVLELVVTDHLYKTYPGSPEGELTAYRSALVNAVILSDVAEGLGMNEYLLLSKGESKDTGKARMNILANTFESFVGALYLDGGYDAAQTFIQTTLFPKLEEIVRKKLWRDPKSLVQEKAQEYLHLTPSYKVISESGPDHDKRFVIGIHFGHELIAEGRGKSKQEGETKAAEAALVAKKWLD